MRPRHLAVYGLLLPGQGPFEDFGMGRHMTHERPCTLRGRLYNIGGYPGMVPGTGAVIGQLYRLDDPSILRRLDTYEAFDPARPKESEFVRRALRLAEPDVTAWVYVYNRRPKPDSRITGGSWPDRVARLSGSRSPVSRSRHARPW